jgi:hypothetical protein
MGTTIITRHPGLRRALVAAAAAALTAGLALIPGGRAYASDTTLTCAGSSSTTYSPGLTDTTAQVSYVADQTFGPCLAVGDPTLTGGTDHATGTFDVSCLTFGLYAVNGDVIDWNDGTSSTIDWTTSVVNYLENALQIEQEGTVISGVGAGDTAVETLTLASGALAACTTQQGVTTLGGLMTLAFA